MEYLSIQDPETSASLFPGKKTVWLYCLFLLCILSGCGTNAGVLGSGSWQATGLAQEHIRQLAVDPRDPTRIYASNEQGRVFASSDAGKQWKDQSAGLPSSGVINNLSFDIEGKVLYAATTKGLYARTRDAAWRQLILPDLPDASYTALAFEPLAPGIIYVGTERNGIYWSSNSGSSWTPYAPGMLQGERVRDLEYDPQEHQLWVTTDQVAYRVSNRGASWQALKNGLPANTVINDTLPAAKAGGAPGLIFIGTSQGLFLSKDGGEHWIRGKESLSGTVVHQIYIDFRDSTSQTIYLGTDVGALRSADNGETWGLVASGMPRSQPIYAIALGAKDYERLYAAGNGIYVFPGDGGGFDIGRVVPLILIGIFFYILYRIARRGLSGPGRRPGEKTDTQSEEEAKAER